MRKTEWLKFRYVYPAPRHILLSQSDTEGRVHLHSPWLSVCEDTGHRRCADTVGMTKAGGTALNIHCMSTGCQSQCHQCWGFLATPGVKWMFDVKKKLFSDGLHYNNIYIYSYITIIYWQKINPIYSITNIYGLNKIVLLMYNIDLHFQHLHYGSKKIIEETNKFNLKWGSKPLFFLWFCIWGFVQFP